MRGSEFYQKEDFISWSDTDKKSVKYYSGTPTYIWEFTIEKGQPQKKRNFLACLRIFRNIEFFYKWQ